MNSVLWMFILDDDNNRFSASSVMGIKLHLYLMMLKLNKMCAFIEQKSSYFLSYLIEFRRGFCYNWTFRSRYVIIRQCYVISEEEKKMYFSNNAEFVFSSFILFFFFPLHQWTVHIQSGRNIRHLPCVVRRSGIEGVCMFAIDCIKANGTHLGTCIDRFYFGSCCQLKVTALFSNMISNCFCCICLFVSLKNVINRELLSFHSIALH